MRPKLLTALGVVLSILFVGALLQYAYVEGDTWALLAGTDGVVACLRQQGWALCPQVGKFPLLQYLSSVPLRAAGASPDAAGLFLARISTGAYLATFAVSYAALVPRSRSVALAVVLILASGELIHYATHSFVEMSAAFLTVAFAAAWLRNRPWAVAVSGCLAAISKETALPFLALLALLCCLVAAQPARSLADAWSQQRRRISAAAAGFALGLLLTIAFNWFRFRTVYNPLYVEEAHLGPDLAMHALAFVALWISPGGGWLFFWPLFVAFSLAVPLAVRRHGRPASTWTYAPLWGAFGMLVLLTAFLSGWWAPFGWWAWGQRLMLPWLPALLLVLAYAYSVELEALLREVLSTPRRATLWVTLVVLLSLPHVASVFRSAELITATFGRDHSCDGPGDPGYYRCLRTVSWANASPLWLAYEFVPGPLARGRMLLWIPLLGLVGQGLFAATRGRPSR